MSNTTNRNKKLIHQTVGIRQFITVCILSALSFTANAEDVYLQSDSPSSDEFINAFIKGGAEKNLSNEQDSGSQVRFRGISLKKNTPKPVEKPIQKEQESFNQQVAGNKAASACMADKQSVAVNITFKPNSSNVKDTNLIKNIAGAMNSPQLSDCYFVIEGHTDAVGNDYYNLWLSQKRAGQVKRYLSNYNVTADRLVVVGKGEDELVNRATPNAAENRRVVFKVINYKK
ncbi:MAG: OmpA family protein [Gammaproteobacteria bacterium]|nr:OmpA family protein [Gammaproteobacteria bacterium]